MVIPFTEPIKSPAQNLAPDPGGESHREGAGYLGLIGMGAQGEKDENPEL